MSEDYLKNVLLFCSFHTNKDLDEKCEDIIKHLEGGAKVNALDGNDHDNTPLHKAVNIEALQIIELLLKHGADTSIRNRYGKTPIDLAEVLPKNQTTEEIIKALQRNKVSNQQQDVKSGLKSICKKKKCYKKKTGTTEVGGLYESKLLSLILFRALKDKSLDQFYLGTNISIKGFDDVCIRYKYKFHEKDKIVLIQAKHKENQNSSSNISLLSYYEDYKKIKSFFKKDHEDAIFEGNFDDVDCYLIFYTASKKIIDDKYKINRSLPWLEKNISVGDTSDGIFQIDDIEYLIKLKTDKVIETLAKFFSTFLKNYEKTYTNILGQEYLDGVIRKYHFVLAQNVIKVSENIEIDNNDNSKKFRKGTFRKEFLEATDKLWGELRIKLFGKKASEECSKHNFKLPHTFGNLDLAISDNGRIPWLVKGFDEVFKNYKDTKIIIIDEHFCKKNKLTKGFIDLNGGIEGLVGNLLIHDEETKMLKINNNISQPDQSNQQHPNAENLFNEMKLKAGDEYDLLSYKFDIRLNHFTTLFLNGDEQERQSAKEYLRLLWCFTDQAKEDKVGETLVKEIEMKNKFERNNQNFPRVHSDAIFLKFHNEVQNWWKQIGEVDYLDQDCDFYEKSKTDIVDMLTTLHFVYVDKIIKSGIKFNDNAVAELALHNNSKIVVLKTKKYFLTTIKIYQYFQNRPDGNTFLDLEYIINEGYYSTVISELENNKIKNVILIHQNNDNVEYLENAITKIKNCVDEKIILVTETDMLDENIVSLTNNAQTFDKMIDMTNIQNSDTLLKNWIVNFQGRTITLDRLIDDDFKNFVNSEILSMLMNKEIIQLGKPFVNSKYEEVEEYCIQRKLLRDEEYFIETFKDIDENVVLIVGEPGMGKTILLNQLSVKTKDVEDNDLCKSTWIVYINLKDYCSEFKIWQTENVEINKKEIFRLIFKAAVRNLTAASKMAKNTTNTNHKNVHFKIDFEGDDMKVKTFNCDYVTEFELQLFSHYYNQGNVILLFDGFDEICPNYEKEVIYLLKVLSFDLHKKSCKILQKITLGTVLSSVLTNSASVCNCRVSLEKPLRFWITSRSYNHVKNVLTTALGKQVYQLQDLSRDEQEMYLQKYFSTKLDIDKLSEENEINIKEFLNYMSNIKLDGRTRSITMNGPLYVVYISAMEYFQKYYLKEIKQAQCTSLQIYSNVSQGYANQSNQKLLSASSVPLHLHIAAQYFIDQIKMNTKSEAVSKWDINAKSFNLFEYFLDIKFNKIFFWEKRQVDITIPGNDSYYLRERTEFHEKHKKMALCAIFDDIDLLKVLNEDELLKIHNLIENLDLRDEKSGVIDNVINGVPRFNHMIFAEYFAVEYICDLLKCTIEENQEDCVKLEHIWVFILNIMLYKCATSIRIMFEQKLRNDTKFTEVLDSEPNKRIVFETLLEQGRNNFVTPEGFVNSIKFTKTSLNILVEEDCRYTLKYLLACVQYNINTNSVNEVMEILSDSLFVTTAFIAAHDDLIKSFVASLTDVVGNSVDVLLELLLPSFVRSIMPLSYMRTGLRLLERNFPQIADITITEINSISAESRYCAMDHIRLLWDLISNTYCNQNS